LAGFAVARLQSRLFLLQEHPKQHDQDAEQDRARIHARAASLSLVALRSGPRRCGVHAFRKQNVQGDFINVVAHQFNSSMGAIMATKTDSIKAILAKQPTAGPKAILAALKRKGIKNISMALIHAVKYAKPQRRVTLAQIQAAKAYSAKVRGLDNAKAALAAYSRLADSK
jgi:hypothetical protein